MTHPLPYPRIPHLVPGRGTRDDLELGRAERDALLAVDIEVEEKVDGANVMCWVEDGIVCSSGRSGPEGSDRAGQFGALRAWTAERTDAIGALLAPGDVLYGEWLMFTHTIPYVRLPDLFVALDIRRADGSFLTGEARRATFVEAGLVPPPLIGRGRFTIAELERSTDQSAWGDERAEGVVVRPMEPAPGVVPIAKLVREGFTPIADEEWRHGRPRNGLAQNG